MMPRVRMPGSQHAGRCGGGRTWEDLEVSEHGRGEGGGGAKELKTEDSIWICEGGSRGVGQGDVCCQYLPGGERLRFPRLCDAGHS